MKRGFTLIEILVVVAIIGLLSSVVAIAVVPARATARDTARKASLNGIGRLLWASRCLVPVGGPGDYDLKVIFDEYLAANPSAAAYAGRVPRDPRSGSDAASGYRYLYDASGACALYANLERETDEIDLPSLTAPSAGGGTGVLRAASDGPNGTDRYYQVSR